MFYPLPGIYSSRLLPSEQSNSVLKLCPNSSLGSDHHKQCSWYRWCSWMRVDHTQSLLGAKGLVIALTDRLISVFKLPSLTVGNWFKFLFAPLEGTVSISICVGIQFFFFSFYSLWIHECMQSWMNRSEYVICSWTDPIVSGKQEQNLGDSLGYHNDIIISPCAPLWVHGMAWWI